MKAEKTSLKQMKHKFHVSTNLTAGFETGTVAWFRGDKGYGFIEPDEGGSSVYVHHTGIVGASRTLVEGQKVQFDIIEDYNGPQAKHVRPVM